MVEKRVAVRMVSEGGKVVKAELEGVGQAGSRAFSQLGAAAGGMRGNIQNASYQIGDFAVQVAAGTSASRALAMQLPQLLGGFGVFGAVAGAAAAIMIPLIGHFMTAGEEGQNLSDVIDGLEKSSRSYRDALDAALTPMAKLRQEFGEQAGEVRELRQAMLGIEEIKYLRSLGTAKGSIEASLSDLRAAFDEIRVLQEQVANADPLVGAGAAPMALQQSIELLNSEFGITVDQAGSVVAAMDAMAAAEGPAAVADASRDLVAALVDAARESDNVSDGVLTASEAAYSLSEDAGRMAEMLGISADEAETLASTDMATGVANAGAEAWSLAEALQLAARNAAALAAGRVGAGAGRGSDPRKFETDPYWKEKYFPEPLKMNFPKPGRAAGGGGGGGIDKDLREAERWFEKTRTAAEKYNAELAELNELQRAGKIDAETYARAIKLIEEKYKGAGDSAKFFESLQDDLKNGFLDAIVAGESLSDVFQNLAQSIAKAALEAALFGSGPFAAGSGGLLSSIFGGGGGAPIKWFADGGVVNRTTAFGLSGGGVGVMGEAGPEAILPLVRASGGALGVRAVGGGSDAPQRVIVEVHPSGEFDARVAGTSQRVAVEVVRGYDRVQPQRVKQILRDERRVG